jgi:hypothetical protein
MISAVISTGISFGQQNPDVQVKVLTVCEVLGDVNRFADTAVVVVGRMERSVSLIDHYEFLSQDGCGHPINAQGAPWSQKIEIWTTWEEGMPKPPSDRPKLNRAAIAAKLSVVRKATNLGSHEEPRFKSDGHTIIYSHTAVIPDDWAVVYGRIVKVPDGDQVQLMILANPDEVRKVGVNGTLLPNKK